jgi:hypothetical protein
MFAPKAQQKQKKGSELGKLVERSSDESNKQIPVE